MDVLADLILHRVHIIWYVLFLFFCFVLISELPINVDNTVEIKEIIITRYCE